MSSRFDCGLCMPVQYHVGSQAYETLDFAVNLLACTEMREQYMLVKKLVNMLKLDNGCKILSVHSPVHHHITLHVATIVFVELHRRGRPGRRAVGVNQ